MTAPLLLRLGDHDRALMLRCVIRPSAPRGSRLTWTVLTHLGGTGVSLLAAGLPLLSCCPFHQAAKLALATVALSHLFVQIAKRTVARRRPAKVVHGHATASMSVALVYGMAFPTWAVPLLVLALLIGFSRVRLGVHFPSDVLVGQLIAALTAAGLSAL